MKRFIFTILIALTLFGAAASAQNTYPRFLGQKTTAQQPASCVVGEYYFNVTIGKYKYCSATNTWTLTIWESLGGGGGISDGDKGDVIISGTGTTFTVDNSAITTAKMGGDVTGYGKNLLTASSVANQRTVLGLSAIAASGSAADLASGTVPTARLGTGTASSTTYLRGDGTWATPAGGGGGSGDALVANPLSQFANTTSAQLAGIVTNETGSGSLVFGTSPNITTPTGIVKADVGLGNVDNTSDANKPVSTAVATALNLKANLASPALTGVPTVPNIADGTSTAQIANTAFVSKAVSDSASTKQDALVSGTNIKTVNSTSVLGSGNIVTTTPSSTDTFTNKTIDGSGTGNSVINTTASKTKTVAALTSCAQGDIVTLTAGSNGLFHCRTTDTQTELVAASTAGSTAFQYPRRNAANNAFEMVNLIQSIIIAASDETTAITTGTAKVTFRMPYAFTLTAVRASLTTASSSGLPTINIKESGTTILSTNITIDATEKTSVTALTPPVISDVNLADDAEITIDVVTSGTGAAGLKITLIGFKNS